MGAPQDSKLLIGPSNGRLYARGIYNIRAQKLVLQETGANCVEMCLGSWGTKEADKRMNLMFDKEKFAFNYTSFHIPEFVTSIPSEFLVRIVKIIIEEHPVNTVLIHPLKVKERYPEQYYREMVFMTVPLGIENMDSRKDSGFDITELVDLIDCCKMKLILDVQHAYEHDHTMQYARDLLAALNHVLVHLHVRGETEKNNHSLVYKATNTTAIMDFLAELLTKKQVPLILEGEHKNSEELKAEIEFLRKELTPCIS